MTNDRKDQGSEAYPGEKARQGRIILRHKSSRLVFIGGLVAIVVLAVGAYWL